MVRVSGLRALEGDPYWVTGLETFGQTMDHAEGGMALPGDTVTMTVGAGTVIALLD
ncbi:MAG: hypothetical protein JWP48_2574 [Actinoallomurus sp.]|nr:hypothetical protein [Actinoallomurus sp.]